MHVGPHGLCVPSELLWNHSPLTLKCNLQCQYRFTTAATCDNTDCLWNAGDNMCEMACARYQLASTCSANYNCEWDQELICSTAVSQRQQCGANGISQE